MKSKYDDETSAVILDLVTRRQIKGNLKILAFLQKHNIHTEIITHFALVKSINLRTSGKDSTYLIWEQTYETIHIIPKMSVEKK